MAQEASASEATNSFPQQRTQERESDADRLPTERPGGSARPLSLERLLSVALLTPAQAVLVAERLLDAAAGSGTVHGSRLDEARLGAVSITATGEVEVAAPHADAGTLVTALLDGLLQNARRLPAHPRPEQLRLLRSLEEAAGDTSLETSARARALEGALAEHLGPAYSPRLSHQLGALVSAFAHVAPSVPAAVDGVAGPLPMASRRAVPAAGSSGSPSRRAAPARVAQTRPAHRNRSLLHRRTRPWRVALVVLILAGVLAGGGYLLLRGPGAGILGAFGGGNPGAAPNATASAQPSKHPAKHQGPRAHQSRAVPALAGRHAGPVTGVAVQETGSCKPGAQCRVRVTVHLRPASTARSVGWKVGAARLCKHGIAWSPGATVTARPGWTTVYAHSSVRVPQGRSLALIALTTAPARAQSRPVPVTRSSLHC